jgi:transcription elongation factor GreA
MSAKTKQVWLTKEAHDRLLAELSSLLAQRENGATAQADVTDQERRELRIRQLQEVLGTADVQEPPDDGVAEPGMVLTVRYEDEHDVETFLMADREEAAAYRDLRDLRDLEVCSPQSPMGRALAGAVQGEQREYVAPGGVRMKVTLLKAVPHRGAD